MKGTLLFLLCFPVILFSQNQVSQQLTGNSTSELFGWGISMSKNGNVVACGAFGGNNGDGLVRVYENLNDTWTQIGIDITSEAGSDRFGQSVSLNIDGSIIAAGAIWNDGNGNSSGHVRVYENINGVWIQIGQDIDGELSGDQSGFQVQLSDNGNIVAISSILNLSSTGHVRVYENINGVWTQIGQDLDGEDFLDEAGTSISLSSNGNILAIGAPRNDGNGSSSGHVRVYENINGTWSQLGQDIDGESSGNRFGTSVDLSDNGEIVVVGARTNTTNIPISAGQVRVFRLDSGNWIQLGQTIVGDADGDRFGRSVSISGNGNVIGVGAYLNDSNGSDSGQMRLYSFNGSDWDQVGLDVLGENSGWGFGYNIDLSRDGSQLMTANPFFDTVNFDEGLVRIYSFEQELALYEVVDDIQGNLNGISVTAEQLNVIDGVSGAIDGVNYTDALDAGAFADENNPTAAEIQLIIDQVNATLSVETFEVSNFNIYPNPAKTQFTVQLRNDSKLKGIQVYNTLGQLVLSSKDPVVNTTKLSSGSYLVEVSTDKGTATKQLIIN